MPTFSVVIPVYNNRRYLPECVGSVTGQGFDDFEIIIVDDASTDDTYRMACDLAARDRRIATVRHTRNTGTLGARRTGVLRATGRYVLLLDQDDELAPGTLSALAGYAKANPADIYHFGVRVQAANPAARQAADGMRGFLTPRPRTLHGADILRVQFSPDDGFDWHVHHKMYDARLVKRAYGMATDERLLVADDFYMCFLLDSLAHTYRAIPDSPWYVYHLGRGDTFGKALTVRKVDGFARWDASALRLIKGFADGHKTEIRRDDWDERLADARDRLIEHTMNEWKDNLADADKPAGLSAILDHWTADAVCGELYRYVRDYAYAYFVSDDRRSERSRHDRELALRYLSLAEAVEDDHRDAVQTSDNLHYLQLRDVAFRHLRDGGILDDARRDTPSGAAQAALSPLRRLMDTLSKHLHPSRR